MSYSRIIFLSNPSNQIKEIGFFTGAAYLASLLLEIPTGYIADKFGHKRTLILSKFLKLASTICFLLGHNVWWYTAGAVLGSLGFAFASGTKEALIHETLKAENLDKKYGTIMTKTNGLVAIISALLIATIPLLFPFGAKLPIAVWIPFDILGIFVARRLIKPPVQEEKVKTREPLRTVIKKLQGTHFYVIAIFSALVRAVFGSGITFQNVYLESLAFPVLLLGVMKGIGRGVWFLFSRFVGRFEKTFSLRQMFLIELFFFPIILFLTGLFQQPYLVALIGILGIGYMHGRRDIIDKHLLNRIVNPKYKATLMSFTSQITSLIMMVATFGIGFVMDINYRLGYFLLAGGLFVALAIAWLFVRRLTTTKQNFEDK